MKFNKRSVNINDNEAKDLSVVIGAIYSHLYFMNEDVKDNDERQFAYDYKHAYYFADYLKHSYGTALKDKINK